MNIVTSLCALFLVGCGSLSPTAPAAVPVQEMRYPAAFAPVMAALDAETWIHPLIGEPMGTWVRRHTQEITFDSTIAPGFIAWAYPNRTIGWNTAYVEFPAKDIELSVAYLLHEVRHNQGFAHTCGNFDRTMQEGGAFAVQILYLEHKGFTAAASALRASSICQ